MKHEDVLAEVRLAHPIKVVDREGTAVVSGNQNVMKQEELVASGVRLASPIAAVSRHGKEQTLVTVGEAARFLLANFTIAQGRDVYWRIAAGALEEAAETDIGYATVHATKAVISLLETERLIRDPPGRTGIAEHFCLRSTH